MQEIGRVEKIDKRNYATVVFPRKQACEHCQMCFQTKDSMRVSVRVHNTLNAKVGDSVAVDMSERIVLKSALVVYLIPVLLVLVALLLTRKYDEKVQIVAFCASLAISIGIDVIVERIFRKKRKTIAVISAIVSDPSPSTDHATESNADEVTEGAENGRLPADDIAQNTNEETQQ